MQKASLSSCVFCGKIASTKDHIPSKNLLEKPYPDNLLTIPSCSRCNRSFSLDEEYFLNVLVEVSDNPTLLSKKEIGGNVYKARERSLGLKKRIEDSFIKNDDGKFYFKSETDRIKRVIEKNALGLYFHRYKKRAELSHFRCVGFYPFSIEETRPPEIFLLTYTEKFKPKRWTIIQKDIFSYIVVRDWRRNNNLSMIFHIHNTVWCIIEIPFPLPYKSNRKNIGSQLTIFD